ncbi:MAG: hypothetical protein M0C28_46305 [Candidatus Moduliflexus flocculans]|nr:hypothetical protein [Candidatus Moduliflexus flocculans]
METATIRIPEEKKNLLKAAASLENRKMNDVVIDLIDEYIESRKETLELLAIPGLLRAVRAASREFRGGQGRPYRGCPKRSWSVVFSRDASKGPRKDGNVRSRKDD